MRERMTLREWLAARSAAGDRVADEEFCDGPQDFFPADETLIELEFTDPEDGVTLLGAEYSVSEERAERLPGQGEVDSLGWRVVLARR